MNYNLYVIYDKIAEQYGTPFPSLNHATATRQFNAQTNANAMAEPTDFELYCVGSYDTSSAQIVVSDKPVFVAKGRVMSHE